MELSEGVAEPKRSSAIQSTSKRVRMIFSVMASPNRIDILRILNAKGPLTYSELKALAGFKSKKESGKFAYHLRKLLRQSLVALNKSERRYTITNLGKLVLSLARQIEERSVIEGGKMYVRSSDESIDEFNSHKIVQSLVREASLPTELAQKITEEVENKIYKYQTSHLTGPLIREIVNSVLLEHGHEEYRNRLARLGMPVFDIQEMVSNVDSIDNGVEGLLFKTGQRTLSEHLLINMLPNDVVDTHLAGDLHITNSGVWSLLPDTIFVNARELLDDGIDPGGKYLDVSRPASTKALDDLATSLSIAISLIAKEASQEVVIDAVPQVFSKHAKNPSELESRLTSAFATASPTPKYNRQPTIVSIRLQLGSENKTNGAILNAYHNYVKMTPMPRIGLILDHDRGRVSDVSAKLAEIVSLGGIVALGKGPVSSRGITNSSKASTYSAIKLQSVSINLPRLAFESNKDETYFRARLALLIKPALDALTLRKKDVSDQTRRALNPILAKNSQYVQRSSISLIINLVGLREAVFNILGYQHDKTGRGVLAKVVETVVDMAGKKGKDLGAEVKICMTDSDGAARFSILDAEKYGKNAILGETDSDSYEQSIVLAAADVAGLDAKSNDIVQCNKLAKMLNGGLGVKLDIARDASAADVKKAIEKTAELVPFFAPIRPVPICGECGFKGEGLEDKCPKCKSPSIIEIR